jgi:hypothetical protein
MNQTNHGVDVAACTVPKEAVPPRNTWSMAKQLAIPRQKEANNNAHWRAFKPRVFAFDDRGDVDIEPRNKGMPRLDFLFGENERIGRTGGILPEKIELSKGISAKI